MILRSNRFSPFARKVGVCAHELGVASSITLVDTDPHSDETLRRLNPLCKVPTLILDDGNVVYDSAVICDYLSAMVGDSTIVPPKEKKSWPIFRDAALGDGINDAAVALRMELLRPELQQSTHYIHRQVDAIDAALDYLEGDCQLVAAAARLDIGTIAIACALGYLDLRHPSLAWRARRNKLAQWYGVFANRDSMRSTSAL